MASDVMAVATGGGHTCAIKLGGFLWCWGRNNYGQLGIGSTTDKLTPTVVPAETFTTITLGPNFSCGIRTSGAVACWGLNSSGQVGLSGNNQHSPYTVGAVTGAIAVGCGGQHACAVNSSGAGFCWGVDYIGQLADGTTSNSYPHQVAINSAANLGLGENHTCYLSSSAGMYCAGENISGQLGMGTNSSQTSPVAVSGMVNSTLAIDAGFNTTCAVKTDGSVRCWGLNDHGQLGNGTLSSSNIPAQVTGLSSGFTVVRVGKYHACALSESGYLMCWGENENGQLGDGTTTDHPSPVPVIF
jgi:alpha-tubulin suppressor-like RCC1 family protein